MEEVRLPVLASEGGVTTDDEKTSSIEQSNRGGRPSALMSLVLVFLRM